RGEEPETDLTRPSLENLPGFVAVSSSAAATTTAPAAAPQAAPALPPADQNENLREALEESRRAAEAKQRQPLVINIPGVSTAPIVVNPPAEKPAPAVAETPAAPALPAPAEAPAVSTQAAANLNPALVELDAKIAVKEKELADKEAAYKAEQAASEKNLLDLESRKTEILLGKIHRAVQEVARREGVSVVVDKSSILYGHDAVDLTDKVMKYLRGS
ncbi:MAG: OmpH family outer membrane protein, partial [Elusimicrobia bacterium]|nr:OmpH family outer membrane protein [Elusimicrobiota bacterium]